MPICAIGVAVMEGEDWCWIYFAHVGLCKQGTRLYEMTREQKLLGFKRKFRGKEKWLKEVKGESE
jgi:hypothetical protein